MAQDKLRVQVNSGENFIVRINEKYFFLTFGDDGEDVRGTLVLSEAAHLSYRDADILTQSLRNRGYQAVVNDRYGVAVTEQTLRSVDIPPIPITLDEYNTIPAAVMKRRYYSEEQFRRRLDAAIEQGIIKFSF